MTKDRRSLEDFRLNRESFVKSYVGRHYGRGGPRYDRIINMMFQAADIYTMSLAANRPRVLVNSYNGSLKSFGKRYQLAVNNYIKTMGIEEVLEGCCLDAFFSLGIAKVHLADSHIIEIDANTRVDPGKPWVKRISLDDWCHDTSVKEWFECGYMADGYQVPYDRLQDDLYDQKVAEQLSPGGHNPYGGEGSTRVEGLTKGYEDYNQDNFEEMVDLVDVWFPREKVIVTWGLDMAGTRWELKNTDPLIIQDWDGPESVEASVSGPYHIVGFSDVPDNTMALSPAMNLCVLDDLANGLFRKLDRQARRQKTYHIFKGTAEEDAKRQRKVADGEMIKVADPDAVREVSVGGVDQGNLAFTQVVRDTFDRMAGNLPAMGGLGTSADTVGQEKMIGGQISKREAKMQYRMVRFTTGVIKSLGHLIFYDPVLEIPGEVGVPGTNISTDASWTPEMREGDFLNYNFEIEPYSMAYKPPAQRAQDIQQFVANSILPMLPNLEAQGGSFDLKAFLEWMAELMDEPRLLELIKFQGLMPDERPVSGNMPDKARQAPHTVRENVRSNVSHGPTSQAQTRDLVQQFMNSRSPQQQTGAA